MSGRLEFSLKEGSIKMRIVKLISYSLVTLGFCLLLIDFVFRPNIRLKPFRFSVVQTMSQDGAKNEKLISTLNARNRTKTANEEIVFVTQRDQMSAKNEKLISILNTRNRTKTANEEIMSATQQDQMNAKNEKLISILNTRNRTKTANEEIMSATQQNQMNTTSYLKETQTIPEPINLTDTPMNNMIGLLKYLRQNETPSAEFLVPNVVHYVWLTGGRDLRFHEVLGILSAQKYLNPDVIKLHCDREPTGKWWKLYKNRLTSLKIVNVDPNIKINGIEPWALPVKSDILRMHILQREGGIYLDFDVIVIQSFDDLRKYEFSLGLEYHGNPGRLNNGIIISAPNARFLKVWFETYKDFKANEWDEHSCAGPYILAPKYPSLIHVDENRLNYPGGNVFQLIYYHIYNWPNNYAMHLWYRVYLESNPALVKFTPENIKTLNSTFGEIARRTLYDSPELILNTTYMELLT